MRAHVPQLMEDIPTPQAPRRPHRKTKKDGTTIVDPLAPGTRVNMLYYMRMGFGRTGQRIRSHVGTILTRLDRSQDIGYDSLQKPHCQEKPNASKP